MKLNQTFVHMFSAVIATAAFSFAIATQFLSLNHDEATLAEEGVIYRISVWSISTTPTNAIQSAKTNADRVIYQNMKHVK